MSGRRHPLQGRRVGGLTWGLSCVLVSPRIHHRRFFGKQSKECKALGKNLWSMIGLATGENWLPFWNEGHNLLGDSERLSFCGVWLHGDAVAAGLGCNDLAVDHPIVQEQDRPADTPRQAGSPSKAPGLRSQHPHGGGLNGSSGEHGAVTFPCTKICRHTMASHRIARPASRASRPSKRPIHR